jgi:hypothetical protein
MPYITGFIEALEVAAEPYSRIAIKDDRSIVNRIFVDGGREHAYFVSYVQGQDPTVPEAEWRSTLNVTYGSENEYYTVLDLSGLPLNDIFKDVETLAFLAVRAVREHINKGFQPVLGWGISPYRLTELEAQRRTRLNA